MSHLIELETVRLKLRQWCDQDKHEFAVMNADPEVMAYYPSTLNTQQSDELADRIRAMISSRGWGFWAVELKANKRFIGFVGLNEPNYALPVSPLVEIGWRLHKEYWGRGLATEAARASLDVAFNTLSMQSVYAFTATINKRSIALMERLGMADTQQNFDHPRVPRSSPLSEHVLYKIETPV